MMFVTRTPPLIGLGTIMKSNWKGFGPIKVLFSLFPTYIVLRSAGKSRFNVYGTVVCIYSISSCVSVYSNSLKSWFSSFLVFESTKYALLTFISCSVEILGDYNIYRVFVLFSWNIMEMAKDR